MGFVFLGETGIENFPRQCLSRLRRFMAAPSYAGQTAVTTDDSPRNGGVFRRATRRAVLSRDRKRWDRISKYQSGVYGISCAPFLMAKPGAMTRPRVIGAIGHDKPVRPSPQPTDAANGPRPLSFPGHPGHRSAWRTWWLLRAGL